MSKIISGNCVPFLIVVAVVLAGCVPPEDGIGDQHAGQFTESISITVAFAGGDNAHKKGIQTIINDFKKTHLNVQIKDIHSRDEPYSDFLVTKDAVGEFPDLVEMRNTQMFVDAGLLSEMPQDIQYLFGDIPKVNGKVYNAPIAAIPPNGIIYNKKLFRQLGIDHGPQTYQEFMDICRKIKQSGISPLYSRGQRHLAYGILGQ
ncbi:ABC transporter substrate-binding protein [Paenibacillus sedimenti]|uniref:Extracellular solute-binding protein n=1 Tax=Paenibacillus sedimenti TaxID=2770274 RepID=A0A926KSZ7_9BACL|nr:extracellular solute-binding protein [Paenibacillus sedimenti]MBD0382957.1 extracellular solute-binding protein [Paenibacillus sedimenti]